MYSFESRLPNHLDPANKEIPYLKKKTLNESFFPPVYKRSLNKVLSKSSVSLSFTAALKVQNDSKGKVLSKSPAGEFNLT